MIIVARYVVVILLPVVGWLFGEVLDLREAQAVTLSNRFTSQDSIELKSEFTVQLNTLSARVEDLRREVITLPRENPPQWFVDRVAKLEANYEQYDLKMDRMSELLIRIDTQVQTLAKGREQATGK